MSISLTLNPVEIAAILKALFYASLVLGIAVTAIISSFIAYLAVLGLIVTSERALEHFGIYIEILRWVRHREEFRIWLAKKKSIQAAIKEVDSL
jgi:hypothetical protein